MSLVSINFNNSFAVNWDFSSRMLIMDYMIVYVYDRIQIR